MRPVIMVWLKLNGHKDLKFPSGGLYCSRINELMEMDPKVTYRLLIKIMALKSLPRELYNGSGQNRMASNRFNQGFEQRVIPIGS
jgi:hypothetical protein